MTVHKIGAPRWTAKLPICPACRKEVDPTGDLHSIAWVKGVLWHEACWWDQQATDEAES